MINLELSVGRVYLVCSFVPTEREATIVCVYFLLGVH